MKKAFTLVELLVVISIIALLLSVLMPALSKARDAARFVICSNNTRQSGLLLTMYQHENKFYPPYAFPTLGLQFWHKPMSQAFSAGEYSYWPLLVVPRDQRVAAKAPKFLFCPAQSNKNKVDTWYVNVSYGYNYGKFGDWLDGYSAPKSVTAESVKNPSSVLMLCESRQMVGYGRSSRPDETKGCAYLYPPGPETLNRFWTPTNCEQYMANRHPVGGPKATSFVPVLWADGHSSKEIRKGLYSSESVTKWGFVPDK